MCLHGWTGVCGRRKVRTTTVDKTATAASGLVARDFNPEAPDLTWAGDITYIPSGEGWLYLSTVLDPVLKAGDRLGSGRPSPHRTDQHRPETCFVVGMWGN